MATKIVYLSGTGRWVKPYPGQEDIKFEKKVGMDLYLDEKSMITFKASGSRLKLHKDEHGTFIKLARKVDQMYQEEPLGYPIVVKKDENGEYKAFTEEIGNGTELIAKIAVYESKFGMGSRWEALEIVNHVPYEKGVTGSAAATALADGKYKF